MPRTDKVLDGYYKTAYWKRRRLAQAETPPRTTPATTVDHKIPFVNWNSFGLGELRSLCAHHHYSHAQFERNRGYPKRQIGVDGYPIDSQANDDPPDQTA